jgi:hypothetical protein
MTHTCDTCHAPVNGDAAFVRSINLRTVAWCRPCWIARNPHLAIPAQRETSVPAVTPPAQRKPRRWVPVMHKS